MKRTKRLKELNEKGWKKARLIYNDRRIKIEINKIKSELIRCEVDRDGGKIRKRCWVLYIALPCPGLVARATCQVGGRAVWFREK